MASFKTRIKQTSKKRGKVILAIDYNPTSKLESKIIKNIKNLNKYLCGLKFNFHVILPLGLKEITHINKVVHRYGLQSIADIKLNDIGNTNKVTVDSLWKMGFDAVIVNPIMGKESLRKLTILAHKKGNGIIALCHMSAPEAKSSYEMNVNLNKSKKQITLYQLFLDWSLSQKVDGIIVGATYPEIIKYCKKKVNGKLNIYSPGIGTQGGNAKKVLSSGTDYLIVGRTILNSKNPIRVAKQLQQLTFDK